MKVLLQINKIFESMTILTIKKKCLSECLKKGYNALNYKLYNSSDDSNEQMELF